MNKILSLLSTTALSIVPGGGVLAALGAAATGFVRFATSTTGVILIAAGISFWAGHHVASSKCDAAAVRQELEATKADLTAAHIAANMAASQAAEVEANDKANQDKVNALVERLKTAQGRVVAVPGKDRVVYSCGLSGDDARQLRDIR